MIHNSREFYELPPALPLLPHPTTDALPHPTPVASEEFVQSSEEIEQSSEDIETGEG